MSRSLVVKLTCGAEAPERANQALTVATAAVVAGAPVSLWLTGEAVWFAVQGRTPDLGLEHATSAADLMASLADTEPPAEISVCSQCARRRGIAEDLLVPGAQIRGAASFAELVLRDDVQALVY